MVKQMASTRTFKTTTEVETASTEAAKKPTKIKSSRPSIKLPWLIVILLIAISGFMYYQYQNAKKKIDSSTSNSSQINSTLAKVTKIAVVPTNETPTIATIKNVSKLKSQLFFANAQDGDRVIVYSKSGEAVLYRPSTNQIVNISAVNVK